MERTDASKMVVVGVDGTEDAARAIQFGVAEARRRNGFLRIVHVQPDAFPGTTSPNMPVVPDSTWHEVAAGVLKDAEQQAREAGYDEPHLEGVLANGPRRRILVRESEGASCLVLGTRTAPMQHLVAGSTTASLAAHASVPVIAVPPTWNPAESFERIVVGTDTPEVTQVIEKAFDVARDRRARLEVLHAWRPRSPYDAAIGSRVLADAWSEAVRTALTRGIHDARLGDGVEWTISAHYERAVTALYHASSSADLLVVGRHGHSAPHGLMLGSLPRTLIRTSPCPVMVVPTTHRGG